MADIFISYRREGGEFLAHLLYERLKGDKYSVFLDVESMRSGKFNDQLLEIIANCKDFILLLPEKALDRCSDPNDWVRQEIAQAIKCNKNIIPVLMRNFEFPKNLTEDIDDIRNFAGVIADMSYFDAVVVKLKNMLISLPVKDPKSKKYQSEDTDLILEYKNKFRLIAENICRIILSLRKAFNNADEVLIADSLNDLTMHAQTMQDFSFEVMFIDDNLYKMACEIVNQYNQFADKYNVFAGFKVRGSTEWEEYFNKMASALYNMLLTISKYINEIK